MKIATEEDLRRLDDPKSFEYPPEFNYRRAMARVANLRVVLSSLVGHPLEQDQNVQDASFFTDLYYRDPVPQEFAGIGKAIATVVAVRFSCFGDLFSIWGNSERYPLTQELVATIAEYVSGQGFVYVPSDLLDKESESPTGLGTWALRYFDYI
jgi:hypothetical protein